MQVNTIPGFEYAAAKSRGNPGKEGFCFPPMGGCGPGKSWAGPSNMGVGTGSREHPVHSKETGVRREDTGKEGVPGGMHFFFGIQPSRGSEEGLSTKAACPGDIQLLTAQEGEESSPLLELKFQGLTEFDTQEGLSADSEALEEMAETGAKIAETDIPEEAEMENPGNKGIRSSAGEIKVGFKEDSAAPVDPETGMDSQDLKVQAQGEKSRKTGSAAGGEKGSPPGKGVSPGQGEEPSAGTVGNTAKGLNTGKENAGFSNHVQRGSTAVEEASNPIMEEVESKVSGVQENAEQAKPAAGTSRAEGVSLVQEIFAETSAGNTVSGPQQSSPKAPVRGEDLVSQLVEKLEISRHPERSEMKVQLKPEHLGEVTIYLVKEKDTLKARLVAESIQVKEALQTGLSQLRDRLESQNVKVVELHVEVDRQQSGLHSEGGSQSGFHQAGEAAQKNGGKQSSRGGDAAENELPGQEGVTLPERISRVDCLV